MVGEADAGADDTTTEQRDATHDGRRPSPVSWVPRVGVWAWSFVGVVVVTIIVVAALAAVSEIVLPLIFAAVLAVVFKPAAEALERRGLKPSLGAGLIVLGLLALATGIGVALVRGVTQQTDEISASVNAALDKASDSLEIDQASLESARDSVENAAPTIGSGFVTEVVSGVSTLIGVASGMILGALIMYYLLKDGTRFRCSIVAQFDPTLRDGVDDFFGDAGRTLVDYGRGRTVMSAIVAVVIGVASLLLGLPLVFTILVVNFVGGYIPYIGAFLGGGFAVIVALGDGGLEKAAIMLVIVLAANLLLENFVEPKVMSRSLDIHPLIVLVVTAMGGIVGGIVGLILAVPAYVIAHSAIARLRSGGFFEHVADRAEPTVQRLLN
jgi:putative heme transporter